MQNVFSFRAAYLHIKTGIFLVLITSSFYAPDCFSQAEKGMESKMKKQADKYFDEEDFIDAYPLYSQLLSLYPKNPDYNYKFGTCMLLTKPDKQKPEKYLEYAVKQTEVDVASYYFLGRAYHLNYRFDDAIKYYTHFEEVATTEELKKYPVTHLIEMCNNGKTLLVNVKELDVLQKKRLGRMDFYGAYDLKSAHGGSLLWEPENLKTSTDKHKKHSTVVFIPSGSDMLYYSSYGDDDKNGTDIYRVKRLSDGTLGKPENLGNIINTPYDEDYPYYDEYTHTLYFSSKGHNSMGGYDIFKSVYNYVDKTWSEPINLDFPINSPDDDFLFIPDSSNKTAFFSSVRYSSKEDADVYKINLYEHPPDLITLNGKTFKDDGNTPTASTITVKEINSDKIAGVFNAGSDGTYTMNLKNGGRYIFTIETQGQKTEATPVILPYKNDVSTLTQNIRYDAGSNKVMVSTRNSEASKDSGYMVILDYIKSEAAMEITTDSALLAPPVAANIKPTTSKGYVNVFAFDNAREEKDKGNPGIGNGKKTGNPEIENKVVTVEQKIENESTATEKSTNYNAVQASDYGADKLLDSHALEAYSIQLTQAANNITDTQVRKDSLARAGLLKKKAIDAEQKALGAYFLAANANKKIQHNGEEGKNKSNDTTAGELIRKQAVSILSDTIGQVQNLINTRQEIEDLQLQAQEYLDKAQQASNEEEKTALFQQAKDLADAKKSKENEIAENRRNNDEVHHIYAFLLNEASKADSLSSQQSSNTVINNLTANNPSGLTKDIMTYEMEDTATVSATEIEGAGKRRESERSKQREVKSDTVETAAVTQIVPAQPSETEQEVIKSDTNEIVAVTQIVPSSHTEPKQAKQEVVKSDTAEMAAVTQIVPSSHTEPKQAKQEVVKSDTAEKVAVTQIVPSSPTESKQLEQEVVKSDTAEMAAVTQIVPGPPSETKQAKQEVVKSDTAEMDAVTHIVPSPPSETKQAKQEVVKNDTAELDAVTHIVPIPPSEPILTKKEVVKNDTDAVIAFKQSLNNASSDAAQKKQTTVINDTVDMKADIETSALREQMNQKIFKGDTEQVIPVAQTVTNPTSGTEQTNREVAKSDTIKMIATAPNFSSEPGQENLIADKNDNRKLSSDTTVSPILIAPIVPMDTATSAVSPTYPIASAIPIASVEPPVSTTGLVREKTRERSESENNQVNTDTAASTETATIQKPETNNSDIKKYLAPPLTDTSVVPEKEFSNSNNSNVTAPVSKEPSAITFNQVIDVNPPVETSVNIPEILPASNIQNDSNTAIPVVTNASNSSAANSNPIVSDATNPNTDANKSSEAIAESVDIPEEFIVTTNVANRPITIDPQLPEGLIFKIQVGAFRNPIEPSLFRGMQPLTGETTIQGFIRYTAGKFKEIEHARTELNTVKGMGFNDAFIVAYYNGKRIIIRDALAKLGVNLTNNLIANNEHIIVDLDNDVAISVFKNPATISVAKNINDNYRKSNSGAVGNEPNVNLSNDSTVIHSIPINDVNGLFFSVQVAALSKKATEKKLHDLQPLYSYVEEDGYTHYNCGMYSSIQKAVEARKAILSNINFEGAFLVAFKNGKRVNLAEAGKLAADNPAALSTKRDMDVMPVAGKKKLIATPATINEKNSMNDTSKTGLVYSVQIGAFSGEIPVEAANKIFAVGAIGVHVHNDGDGITSYTAGSFTNYGSADSLKHKLIEEGLTKSFIVAFKNGKKVSLGLANQ